MKSKQSFEDYVTRNELESTYNYQKKVFDSKLEEVNQIIDKIQECFSLRFGEELGNNKYDQELEQIRNNLDQIKIDNNNEIKEIESRMQNILLGKISEIEIKNQKNIDENTSKTKDLIEENINNLYKDINRKIIQEEDILKEFRDVKLKDLNSNIQFIEERARELKESTDEYAKTFREEIKEIGKDGRSKTAISKLQKTIQEIKENKEEIQNLIDEKEQNLNEKIIELKNNLSEYFEDKIKNLDYENTINTIQNNISNVQEILLESNKENGYAIKQLEEDINSTLENKFEEINFNNIVEDINDKLNELQIKFNTENKYNNIKFEELNNQIIEANKIKEQIEENFKNEINENILAKIEKFEEQRKEENEQNNLKIEKLQENLKNEINENILAKMEKFEEQREEDIEQNNLKINKIQEDFKNEINNLDFENTILNLKNNILELEEKRKEDIESTNEKIKELQETVENEINESEIKKIQKTLKDIKSQNDNLEKRNDEIDLQVQAVLSIVAQLEDKFAKGGFETLANDVGKIIDRQIKNIQNKYEKLFESKLKAFENNLKIQEKAIQNKMMQMNRSNAIPKQNYNIVTLQELENKNNSNIYNEIKDVEIKQSAENNELYDEKQTYLQDTINKLKYQQDLNKKMRQLRKNQILLNYDNDDDQEEDY